MSEICRVRAVCQDEVKTVIVTTQALLIGTTMIPAENIKRQMQSKPNAKKIQLLIETVDAAHLDPKYKMVLESIQEREMLKNALARIIDSDLMSVPQQQPLQPTHNPMDTAQQSLLKQHALLRKLYSQLVPSQMTEDEFWSTRQHLIKAQILEHSQKKGISLGVLSQDTSESVDDGETRFILTPAVIQSIFIQFPSVKSAYQESVPDRVSEQEFWTRYFKSRLFHRIREKKIHIPIDTSDIQQGTIKDDIFDKCLTNEMSNRVNTMTIDDSTPVDVYLNLEPSQQDKSDTGNRPDFTMRMKQEGLIRGLNRQSFGLLEHVKGTRREPVLIDDLNPVEEIEPDKLHITNREDYAFTGESVAAADYNNMDIDTDLINYLPTASMLTDAFIKACEESSAEMQTELIKQNQTLKLSDFRLDLQVILEQYKTQTFEFLRHFWTSISLGNIEKARRMVSAIVKSQNSWKTKLQSLKEKKEQREAYFVTQHLYKSADHIIKKWNQGDFQDTLSPLSR